MAIDTWNKRASAIGVDTPWNRIYPKPDGTLDASDRNQIGYKYSGITTGGVSTALTNVYRTLMGVGV